MVKQKTLIYAGVVIIIMTIILIIISLSGLLQVILPNLTQNINSCNYNIQGKYLDCPITQTGRISTSDNPFTFKINMYSVIQNGFYTDLFSSDYPVMADFFASNPACSTEAYGTDYKANKIIDISSFTNEYKYIENEPNSLTTKYCGTTWYAFSPLGNFLTKYPSPIGVAKGTVLNDKGIEIGNLSTQEICTTSGNLIVCPFTYPNNAYELKINTIRVYLKNGGFSSSNNFCAENGIETCNGQELSICENLALMPKGNVNGKCGYTSTSTNSTNTTIPPSDNNPISIAKSIAKTIAIITAVILGIILLIGLTLVIRRKLKR